MKKIIQMIQKIDETLLTLMIGILAFGLVCQLLGMWFVPDMAKYSIGLWIGIVMSLFTAWHMWWSIDRNLSVNADNEGAARAYGTRAGLIRYALILIVFVVLCLTDFSYPLAAFLGMMGLKIGAYLSPLINKKFLKK